MIIVGHGDQAADMSWWPRHSTWIRSGLNWGYWTDTCEMWFQKRLDAIRKGEAGPKTSTQWNSGELKFYKKLTSKLLSGNEQNSEEALRHCVGLNHDTSI